MTCRCVLYLAQDITFSGCLGDSKLLRLSTRSSPKMHGLTDHILRILSQHWIAVSLTALALWLVKNRYHNGLNKYPGPLLASLTNWWRFVDVYSRRPEVTHRALHSKYGDVVRLGPNTLSFSDPQALKSIYGLNKGFIKVFTCKISVQTIVDSLSSLNSTLSNNPLLEATACSHCSVQQTMIFMQDSAVA